MRMFRCSKIGFPCSFLLNLTRAPSQQVTLPLAITSQMFFVFHPLFKPALSRGSMVTELDCVKL